MNTNTNGYPLDGEEYDGQKHDFPIEHNMIPDDERFFAQLLKDEWSLDGPAEYDRNPPIYWDPGATSTRNSSIASINVYESSYQFPTIVGINYESEKHTKNMSIDIQGNVRERVIAWARETRRILSKNRRRNLRTLNGWDYLRVTSANKKNNYIGNYYQITVEFELRKEVCDLEYDGFNIK